MINNIPAFNNTFVVKNIYKLPKLFKIRLIDANDNLVSDISPFYLRKKSSTNNFETKKQKSTSSLSSQPVLKVMPLGNSITLGYQKPEPTNFNGYRKPLKSKLVDNGLNFDFVGSLADGDFFDNQHEGHGGWHVKHWFGNKNYSLIDHIVTFLQNNHPDIILLHIGTNDIGEYWDPKNDNTIDTTVADVSSLLDSIYTFDPTIQVILAKIISRKDSLSTTTVNEHDTTTAFNNALEIMANNRIANGDNLTLVDMESALLYPNDFSYDGIHPNTAGYDKMAAVWYNALINILPKLSVKIFLEGNYISPNSMNNTLNTASYIPNNQPFNQAPWNYSGTEFASSIPSNIVDWILISLRIDVAASAEIAKRAGFLRTDGTVVDLVGQMPLAFTVNRGLYYIVVQHRNHLPVMSSAKVTISY